MKKIISLLVAVAMLTSVLSACGALREEGVYRVAIVQQMDHPSLDEIRTAIEKTLTARAAENGINIEYKVFNGQNDATVLSQIGAQILADDYDAVIPIATLAAQCMAAAAEGTDIPIIYAAISDPDAAGLTGLPNVTGTSDALNTPFILDMMCSLDPAVRTVGLLYSNSEPNSAVPIAEAKAYLKERGIEILEKTGNTTDEVITAASALVGRVDAVFTPTDNTVMGAAGAVAGLFSDAGIPFYAGADSFVLAGAFAACGVDYTQLGEKTAEMATAILLGGEVPEYHIMEGGIITVNTETAALLGADYAVFANMAGTLREITTGE